MVYLSADSCFKLDKVIKSFEVAYRSYVAEMIISQFPDKGKFSAATSNLSSSYTPSSVMFSHKLAEKIKVLGRKSDDYFTIIEDCNNARITRVYVDNVLYVSELIDYVSIFFNDCFLNSGILKNFSSLEQFQYLSKEYLFVRNALSHPASSKILIKEAQSIILFINKMIEFLDEKYFWYVSKTEVHNAVELFLSSIGNIPIKIHNLREIGFSQNKIVCRETEINQLYSSIVGQRDYYRVAGSVAVYGYGGVGKTALVIEFLYDLIRKLQDNPTLHPVDFILFFSSKEEVLRYSQTTGDFYIDKIKKQITSFEDFQTRLLEYLSVSSIDDVMKHYRGGIVVIDNLENLSADSKAKIFNYIRKSPREIQYLITSREEEPCEDKLYVKEYKDKDIGAQFIREYIEENELDITLSDDECNKLISSSKGNTLILVLSLLSVNDKTNSVEEIVSELSHIKAKDVQTISDFMYKNTFERTLRQLEKDGNDPKMLMAIMALYGEPIDLYSISKLSKIDIASTEYICRILTSKLVLDKTSEFYTINEFANNFIFIKMLPNELETAKLKHAIREHKVNVSKQRQKLEELKLDTKQVANIMQDWKPRNYVDERVIADAYFIYSKIKDAVDEKNLSKIEQFIAELISNELISSHPYIKYQKARAYKMALYIFPFDKQDEIVEIILRSFEDTIQEIEFSYPYIKNTQSHGAVLWLYSIFLIQQRKDYLRSTRYLEDAQKIFSNDKNKNYYGVLSYLCENYWELYKKTKDIEYKKRFVAIANDFKDNRHKISRTGFYVDRTLGFIDRMSREMAKLNATKT